MYVRAAIPSLLNEGKPFPLVLVIKVREVAAEKRAYLNRCLLFIVPKVTFLSKKRLSHLTLLLLSATKRRGFSPFKSIRASLMAVVLSRGGGALSQGSANPYMP